MTDLKISIITVCLNAEKTLERALLSAFSQSYTNIEYVVIDGSSTDKTLAIVQKYQSQIAQMISEPDTGIYDAMNKGIKTATGDVLYFLNADDRLYDNTVLDRVAKEFESDPDAEIVYGKAVYTNIPKKLKHTLDQNSFEYRRNIDFFIHGNPQQCYFVRRSVFDKIGVFNSKYKVAGDYDWLLRCWHQNITMKYLNIFVTFYSLSGLSHKIRYQVIPERIKVVYKNAPLPYFIFYLISASLRKLRDVFFEEILFKKPDDKEAV